MGSGRVRAVWSAASLVLACGVLSLYWTEVARQFCVTMAFRWTHGIGAWGADCDLTAFWPAGRVAREGLAGRAYDPDWFLAYRRAVLFPHAQILRWFYPPPAFLPVMAISVLPFAAAFWAWTVALTAVALWLLWRAGLEWRVIAAGMLSPAAMLNMELGQFGAVTGAAVVAALLLAERAPWVAGLALGGMVIKPQAGPLVAVAMIGRRGWRAVAVAVAAAAALAALVTFLVGWQVWCAYLGEGLAVSKAVLLALSPAATVYEATGVSVFWALRLSGAGVAAAYAAQGLAAVCSAAVVWWVWRRGWGDETSRMAVTVCLSLLATPYGYTDDMVGYSVALAACTAARGWRIDVLDALLFLWPAFCPMVFMRTGVLLTPVVLAVAAARVAWRARGDAAAAPVLTRA